MGDAVPFIKREPTAPAYATPPVDHVSQVVTGATTSVAKRDHLRALLDRARATAQHRRESSASAQTAASPHLVIKREPTNDAGQIPNTTMYGFGVEPPTMSTSTTELLPHYPPGGLLPTPTSGPSRLTESTRLPNVCLPMSNDIPTITSLRGPPPYHHHQHYDSGMAHSQPVHPSSMSGPTASSGFYAATPLPLHAPACSCSHGASALMTHSHTLVGEIATHWHYQAHAPPSVTVPSSAPYATVDHTAIDTAYTELAATALTVSPTTSAATSSSSSSNTKRRSRPGSPSPGGSVIFSKKQSDQVTTREATASERRNVVSELSSAAVSSLDEYEDNELHSDFVHTVHMLIPANSFGCLIGHRGEFVKEINAASECTLSVRDGRSFLTSEADRVLRIYGKPKGICLAQQIVIERIRNERFHEDDSSYVDLDGKPMATMNKSSVTRLVCEAAETGVENEAEITANEGELRWLVHKDSVGKVMGQQGNILKAIARDTNTTIHVVPIQNMAPGSTERTVIITGLPADTESARAIIERKAGGRPEQTYGMGNGNFGQHFVIPQHVAGFLIGPNGTRMRKIRDETGARIQIPAQQDLPLGYRNRTLHIQGDDEQVEKAQRAIVRRLQSYMRSAEATLVAEQDEIALQLVLPVRICAFLLDQRGRLIREISDKAGAHARFLPPMDDEHRVCVLYGDMPKVFRAERLVLQFLAGDAIANKFATVGGAPPRKRKRVHESIDDNKEEVNNEEMHEDIDLDDDIVNSFARSRARKRQQVESSGRIVVHFSAPSRNPASHSTTRRSSTARNGMQAKSNTRGKRRR